MADSPDPADTVRYQLDGSCAVVTLDDGKLNTIGHGTLAALTDALRRAESEATALVLVGGGRAFSAGFDLAVMTEGVESMQGLVRAGADFMLELYGSPLPTVAACTGHALAGGVLVLMCCDDRIGASDRPAKIGLNEVAIGMGLPIFAVELARDRLSPRHLTPAVLGRVYDPAGALEAGYLDQLVAGDDVVATAVALGHERSELRRGAVARTKQLLRERTIAHIRETIDADIASLSGPDA
jgi:enoyl-CoA hydratase